MRVLAIPLVLMAATPVLALPPPLPVNARYGPVTQCLNGYRIQVSDREALSVGADVTLITDRYLLRLIGSPGSFGESQVLQLRHSTLGLVERIVTKVRNRNDGGFRVIGEKKPLRKFTVAYRLPAVGGNLAVAVTSDQFVGTDADFTMLSRVAKIDPAADTCGAFAAPDWPYQSYDALRWSPALTQGTAFRCQNGIGFAVQPGERLRLYWGPEPDTGISELYRGETRFGIRGPIDAARKLGGARGPMAAGYEITKRPISSDSSELILSPPCNDPKEPYRRQIMIPHLNVEEAAARALADRLEFVSARDKRCRRS